MVERAPSSCRPPWFETTSASAPRSTTRRASSGSMMPLTMSLPFQRARTCSRSFQVTEASNWVLIHCAETPCPCCVRRGGRGCRTCGACRAARPSTQRGLAADVERVAQRQPRRNRQAVLRVAAAQARDGNIHRHHQHRATGGLGTVDQLRGVAAILHHVELEPEWRAALLRARPRWSRSDTVLRQNGMPKASRRLRGLDFAVADAPGRSCRWAR